MQALDRITVYRLQVPLKVPYRLVFGPVAYFDTIIAEVIDRDGKTGFGEATILTGYTDETIEDSWRTAKAFAGNLATAGDRAGRLIKELGVKFPFTATAFGTALEMLAGSHLLKLPADTAVPLVGLLNAKNEESMHTEFEQLLQAGYRTIKVKVGFDLDKDIKLVKTFQTVVSGRATIRLDANQAFTAQQGVRFAKALDPAGIELFEQPCAAGDWDSHLAVARVAAVPLMLDESIYGIADIDKAAKLEAATYINDRAHSAARYEAGPRQRSRLRSRLLDGGLHRRAPDRQRRRNERFPEGSRAAFSERARFRRRCHAVKGRLCAAARCSQPRSVFARLVDLRSRCRRGASCLRVPEA